MPSRTADGAVGRIGLSSAVSGIQAEAARLAEGWSRSGTGGRPAQVQVVSAGLRDAGAVAAEGRRVRVVQDRHRRGHRRRATPLRPDSSGVAAAAHATEAAALTNLLRFNS
jgi:hypothetical protein